jgi:hypothetical protein
MSGYTQGYGAITSIVNTTTSYSRTVSGTEYTVEVKPINITSSQITSALATTTGKIWFITYETSMTPPTDSELLAAGTQGQLYMSIACSIVDNCGVIHELTFNETTQTYSIKFNSLGQDLINNPLFVPLSDTLITYIKASDKPAAIARHLSIPSRILFTELMDKISALEARVLALESPPQQ